MISVILPAAESGAELDKTLSALAGQSLPAREFEVIVVDDGADPDRSRIVVKWLNTAPNIRLRLIPEANHALARNAGIAASTGSVLAFTGPGCVPGSDWLERIARHFGNESAGWLHGPVERRNVAAAFTMSAPVEAASCKNLALTRAVLGRTELFDPQFSQSWAAELDFFNRLMRSPAARHFDRELRVADPPVYRGFRGFLRSIRSMETWGLLWKKHPEACPAAQHSTVAISAVAAMATVALIVTALRYAVGLPWLLSWVLAPLPLWGADAIRLLRIRGGLRDQGIGLTFDDVLTFVTLGWTIEIRQTYHLLRGWLHHNVR